MDEHIVEKLRKVLALTTSPIEGEAQAAAGKLAELLTKHNLGIADLETRGKTGKPGVKEKDHDLGKAAFTWKLDLAEGIAKYYYCHPLVNRRSKTVCFVGRPDNVDSLQMLYQWLIDQIRRVSGEERKKWMGETGEHVDPLRWQVNFGIGAAKRLSERLREKADREKADSKEIYALVIHHDTEISDYLEKQYGYRMDGKDTEAQKRWRAEYEERKKRDEELKSRDPEAYYAKYPWLRPLTPEEQAKRDKEEAKREKAREKRRRNSWYKEPRGMTEEEWRKHQQGREAKESGHKAGGSINLEPFVQGPASKTQTAIG